MKIGLYFGSFNPVHIGHMIIAEHIVNNTDLERVWFVVSPQNPFKVAHSLLNEYDRLHLVNCAIEDNVKLKAVDVEFHLPKPSYTITTLIYLQEKYPDYQFEIILGSDSFINLPNWKNFEALAKNYSFLVFLRPGFPVNDNNTHKAIQYRVVQAPLLDISATFIRQQIKEKKSIRYLVSKKVFEEIDLNRFYS